MAKRSEAGGEGALGAIRLVLFFATFLLLTAPSLPAQASIGRLELMLDSSYALDESFDGVSGNDTLLGGGLRLEFDVAYGLSVGLEYGYLEAKGDVFHIYDTTYKLHAPRFSLRYHYAVTDWFEPYVQFAVGVDFHKLTLTRSSGAGVARARSDWKLGLSGMGGVRFLMPKSWVEWMGAWEGFNMGLFVEAGYVYHQPFSIGVAEESNVDIENGRASGQPLGDLDLSGPSWRVGILMRF